MIVYIIRFLDIKRKTLNKQWVYIPRPTKSGEPIYTYTATGRLSDLIRMNDNDTILIKYSWSERNKMKWIDKASGLFSPPNIHAAIYTIKIRNSLRNKIKTKTFILKRKENSPAGDAGLLLLRLSDEGNFGKSTWSDVRRLFFSSAIYIMNWS